MSLVQEHNSRKHSTLPQWVTKTEFHYEYRVAYALISRAVDRGQISIKLDVDGKVKINLEEAKQAFSIVDSGMFD